MSAPPAARTLARRYQARDLYRVRRDRKISVDFLGKDFEYKLRSPTTGVFTPVRLTVVAYNPVNHTVKFHAPANQYNIAFDGNWSTDEFWSALRGGRLVQA